MTHVATIPKNNREELRVSLDEYQGHLLLNLRVWFEASDGDYRPSRKGLALRADLAADLMDAIRQVTS